MRARSPGSGFTLLELLVVVAILAILGTMLMPLLGIARRNSRNSASLSTMAKLEAAIQQFKSDFKAYPYQVTDGVSPSDYSNNLNYTLGTDISSINRANVLADVAAAEHDFSYPLPNNQESFPAASVHTFVANRHNGHSSQDTNNDPEGDPLPTGSSFDQWNNTWYFTYANMVPTCTVLNRMASERAGLLMLIGDVNAMGAKILGTDGPTGSNLIHGARDNSNIPLVAEPLSAALPGWAKDYLQGELDPRFIRGNTVIDAFKNPIIYICQVRPGVESTIAQIWGSNIDINTPSNYGLAPIGRSTLEHTYVGSTTPITGDPVTLPDPTNLLHSDLRAWAAPGYEQQFELWSAGPDGQFDWMRDDPKNRDNIPCENYNLSIPP
jgi:prepilin-type N-terminal cleavage/methylation domain-containing protein